MKKFSFELEQILELRNFEKQEAELELGKALAVENEIQECLNAIAMKYASLKQSMKGSLDFNDFMSLNRHNQLLDSQKEDYLNQLSQAKLVTEQKRKILQECLKKTETLEKLKEAKKEEYKKAVEAEDSKYLEELSTIHSNSSNLEI